MVCFNLSASISDAYFQSNTTDEFISQAMECAYFGQLLYIVHHTEEIRELVEDEVGMSATLFCTVLQLMHYSGCKLIFLPPYLPDYNPIEQAFSSIKLFLWRHWQDNSLAVINRACQNITSHKAAGYFCALGYIV